MRVAWGRSPFAARRGDSAAALAHSELNIGCFLPAPWIGIIIIVWIDYSRGPFDSRTTNAALILHIFAATGEDGRKLMWNERQACLAWRKGLQTLLIIRRQSGRAEHRLRERSRLTQLYVKTNRWHVLLETEWERALACSPTKSCNLPLEGRLVVQANDERWRANLGVARDAGQVETKASQESMESSGWRMTGRCY